MWGPDPLCCFIFQAICCSLSNNLGGVVTAERGPVAAEGNSVLLCLSKSLEKQTQFFFSITGNFRVPPPCNCRDIKPQPMDVPCGANTGFPAVRSSSQTSRIYDKASLLVSPTGFSPGTVTACKSDLIPQFFLTPVVGFLKSPSLSHPTMVYK